VDYSASSDQPNQAGAFATTHWSVILAAGDGDSPQAAAALEKLCRAYWPPLFAFLRRQGYPPPEAQDLVQAFFAELLERNGLGVADPLKGKFRSFLLGYLKHFISGQRDKAQAQKRGGGKPLLPLDDPTIEALYAGDTAPIRSPEDAYERRWALTVLEQALGQLREEYRAADQEEMFQHLEGFAVGEPDLPAYAELALRLLLSESAVKSAIYRLRRRYRECVREEIAQTVSLPEEIDGEIRHLIAVLGN
jgi:RNA polymerase sigma factor (sigma-70 family)